VFRTRIEVEVLESLRAKTIDIKVFVDEQSQDEKGNISDYIF
jgi:hypothetical protein